MPGHSRFCCGLTLPPDPTAVMQPSMLPSNQGQVIAQDFGAPVIAQGGFPAAGDGPRLCRPSTGGPRSNTALGRASRRHHWPHRSGIPMSGKPALSDDRRAEILRNDLALVGTGTTGTGPTQARPITSSGGASRQKGKILYTQVCG
jgi:hypothetical protein